MRGDPLEGFTVFCAVATARSFSAAAAQLQRSPAAISEAIKLLEARLGLRLFARTTRSVALTEAGERLFKRLSSALAEIDTAVEEARELAARPAGLLRINAPRIAGTLVLEPLLARYAAAHPAVTLEVCYDERFVDIVEQGFDAGIRLGEALQQDMISVPLTGPLHTAIVAAPSLLAQIGRPATPEALADLQCIRFRQGSGRTYDWELERGAALSVITPTGSLIVNDSDLLVRAAVSGVGFAYVIREHVARELTAGELVTVLDDWAPAIPGFFLYFPSRVQMPLKLRAFIDLARQASA
jgi:DNA-binding transcriptional LysR family regulator